MVTVPPHPGNRCCSDSFRTRWGAHDVRYHATGVKGFHHPVVGDLTLAFQSLAMPSDPGYRMTIYTAEPGSPSEEGLSLLASWAATQPTTSTAQSADSRLQSM
ncbi:hypothetical protein [Rhodococcus opacus]|uniref:MmyB family transcriptional regulator n=1 Tax=Rhodococcus opacus TaxID=37919 RepID=UPI001300533F|nr:hypothetical protein [Rhodococcus opacus]